MSLETLRRQITLFVPDPERSRLDAIRAQFNPAQAALIAAHVTLCRDDEVLEWSTLQERAKRMSAFELSLRFGAPAREGNLVYLPVVGSTDSFDKLRSQLLEDEDCREQEPHITLVHPRNGTCSNASFRAMQAQLGEALTIKFCALTFIEKVGEEPWRSIQTFPNTRSVSHKLEYDTPSH